MRFKQIFLCCIPFLFLSACVQRVTVKEVVNDKSAYEQQHFSYSVLTENVKQTINRAKAGNYKFKKFKLKMLVEAVSDDVKSEWTVMRTYEQLGKGLVRSRLEFIKNDIPLAIVFMLDFGPVQLKYQSVGYKSQYPRRISHTVEIQTFDYQFLDPQENSTYISGYINGLYGQSGSINDNTMTCKSGSYMDATQVHADLSGQAIRLDCERLGNNKVLASKYTFMYLKDYGVYLQTENSSATSKGTRKVLEVISQG